MIHNMITQHDTQIHNMITHDDTYFSPFGINKKTNNNKENDIDKLKK